MGLGMKRSASLVVGLAVVLAGVLNGCGAVRKGPGLAVISPDMVMWNGSVYVQSNSNPKHGKRLGSLSDSPTNLFPNWAVYAVQGVSPKNEIDLLTPQHHYLDMKFVTSQNITFNSRQYRITALGVGPPLIKQIGTADGLKIFEVSGFPEFYKVGVQKGKGDAMLAVEKVGKVRTVGFAFWRNAYSAWEVGPLPNKSHTAWDGVYAYTGLSSHGRQVQLHHLPNGQSMPTTGEPTIDVITYSSQPSIEAYDGMWICPKSIGLIKITGVFDHVIKFQSKSGITGTFNFVTHQWFVH